MNPIKKLYCRIFQTGFRIALPILPYREPTIINAVDEVPAVMKKEGKKCALLVTDAFLRQNGITAPLEKALEENGITCVVYDKTRPNPTVDNVDEAKELYKEHSCDSLIAFGGGSSMDCAKAVGARIAYPKRTLNQLRGILKVLRRIPMLFAIPTTAGTGSEVTLAAVITDEKKHDKYCVNSFPLIPRYAVLDPKVTYTLPKSLTAATGMDAMTHAVEAYIGRSTTRQTRAMAVKAVKLIFANIQTAYNEPQNKEARANMLEAAYLAGNAFSQSYVGYVHAIAHSLGGQYNIPHGLANSVLLPILLEAYGASVYRKLKKLAVAAGIADENESEQAAAETFIAAIRTLNREMGIPETLSGIVKEDIPALARHADKEANPLYPVPVLWDAKELEIFYAKVADWKK